MPDMLPRVFNIPASAPFLRTLIRALLDGRLLPGFPAGDDPLELARATLYLPTRRACRLAREIFLDCMLNRAAILPRIVPIGRVDEDEIGFARWAGGDASDIAIADAIGDFQRKIALAKLILGWARSQGMRADGGAALVANTPAAAFKLADDLAHLMDDMATRQVSWDRLDDLVPADLDEYWQKTLDFLRIARDAWPAFLADNRLLEPAVRQNQLIAAEAERLARSGNPAIAAGSTGSIPATAALLDVIAKLPNGAVVLPGLDTDLDDETWHAIGDDHAAPSHPQYAMQALLQRIGVERGAVTQLAQPHGRELLLSESMRPAEQTDQWSARLADVTVASRIATATRKLAVIEAGNAEEESLAIAIALREAIKDEDRTAALITPDRALARRVLAALARWNIEADDTAGEDLADTPAGVFARLVADAVLDGSPPVRLLAMLKHPLCRLDPAAATTLERAVLRGPRPKPGTAGLGHALTTFRATRKELYRNDPRSALTDPELDAAEALIKTLAQAIAPLEKLKTGEQAFSAIARAHRDTLNNLAGGQDSLAEIFDEIGDHGALAVARADYAELFHAALSGRPVHKPPTQARVRILGTLESRLQHVDRVVLGGLAEGVWPPETRADPWLSRPMRKTLGLDLPERRIGLSAHDFAQALGADEVILSRAARIAGAPTVASRFVQRLAAVIGKPRWDEALARGERYVAYARALDEPSRPQRLAMPEPKPPVAARPQQLSVTEIEHWLRDPYTIYAKHVLRLFPLDNVDTPPGAADRGTVIHGAIGDFMQKFPLILPDDALAQLKSFGEQHFAPLQDFPEAKAFWWPRFLRVARWLVETFEPERRAKLKAMHIEQYGKLPIPIGAATFTLTGRADRIEQLADGSFAIIDFKTGKPPTDSQVRSGLSPQLTLEAAMLRGGAFTAVAKGITVSQLVYVALRGGEPAGDEQIIKFSDSAPDREADNALARLIGVVARFAEPNTAYRPLAHPMWKTHYGDYDHLARVREWSLSGGAAEPDE